MVNEQMLKEHIVNLCPDFSFHRKIAGRTFLFRYMKAVRKLRRCVGSFRKELDVQLGRFFPFFIKPVFDGLQMRTIVYARVEKFFEEYTLES